MASICTVMTAHQGSQRSWMLHVRSNVIFLRWSVTMTVKKKTILTLYADLGRVPARRRQDAINLKVAHGREGNIHRREAMARARARCILAMHRQQKGGYKGGLKPPIITYILFCSSFIQINGAPRETRTPDPLITNQLLQRI